jgi:hypothetical protein
MVATAVEEERAVVVPTDATRQATNTRSRLWRSKTKNFKSNCLLLSLRRMTNRRRRQMITLVIPSEGGHP